MKKLIILLVAGSMVTGCEKIKSEIAKHTLTIDDIKGAYHGSIYEDIPDAAGGVSTKLYNDTVTISLVGTEIVITSRALGTIKATTGKTTDSTFQLMIPQQKNGKSDTTGTPITTSEDASDMTITNPNLDKKKYFFKQDTLGKDPRKDNIGCFTRYRVVSLEK